MRTIDIIVFSVIAIVIAVSLVTLSMTPKDKTDEDEEKVPVLVSDPVLLDSFGSPVTRVKVGERVVFQSEITNTQDVRQPFVYLVQVKNMQGVTIWLSWMRSELPPDDSLNAAQSWIPDVPGDYEVEVFIWDSIEGRSILSPSKIISLEVSLL